MLIALLSFDARGMAMAEICTVAIDPVAFGLVDVTNSSPVDTTTRFTATCSDGVAGQTLTFCPLINLSNSSGYNRAMIKAGGQDRVVYQLYTDPSRVTLWGNGTATGSVPSFTVQLGPGGQGTGSRTLYARVTTPQLLASVGTYLENLGSGDFLVRYSATSSTCNTPDVKTLTPSMTVNAIVIPQCTMTTQSLEFGNVSSLSNPVTAQGAVSVRCTAGTNYTISLDGGQTNANNPESRWMGGSTPLTGIRYGLYRDAAYLLPWGSAAQAAVGMATGVTQSFPVYGKIAVEHNMPPAGHYTDQVIVTLNY